MSVITQNNYDDSLRFYIKGAPEKIVKLCKKDSIPINFDENLLMHTKQGFRVLACATKYLDKNIPFDEILDDTKRDTYETNLTFLGFIIFRNKLKKDTKTVIQNLNSSDCKIVIATGDNPFTSISVAKECELIEKNTNIMLCDLDNNHENSHEILTIYVLEKEETNVLNIGNDLRNLSNRSRIYSGNFHNKKNIKKSYEKSDSDENTKKIVLLKGLKQIDESSLDQNIKLTNINTNTPEPLPGTPVKSLKSSKGKKTDKNNKSPTNIDSPKSIRSPKSIKSNKNGLDEFALKINNEDKIDIKLNNGM